MLRLLSAVLVFLTTTSSAFAGPDHVHEAKHNGLVAATSGHHNVELVAANGLLQVYVTDHDGAPEDVGGTKASATVLFDGKKEQVALKPEFGNLLKGTVVVITLTMPDHKPEQARFKLD